MLSDRMIKSQMLKSLEVNFPTHIVLRDQEMYLLSRYILHVSCVRHVCRAYCTCNTINALPSTQSLLSNTR